MNTMNTMKTLKNFFPALAFACLFAFGFSSCSEAEASNAGVLPAPATPLIEALAAVEEPDTSASAAVDIELLRAVACTGIESYEPVGAGSSFDREVGRVYVYSKVKMAKGERGSIKHTYYLDGKQVQSISLDVKGPTFRTRSYKTIHKGMEGDWKVEITSAGGKLLDTVTFAID